MTGLGGLTGATGMTALITPSFPGSGLGGQPASGSPVGKTSLSGSSTGLSGFSQIPGQQHVSYGYRISEFTCLSFIR